MQHTPGQRPWTRPLVSSTLLLLSSCGSGPETRAEPVPEPAPARDTEPKAEPEGALAAEELVLPPGFTAELVYSVPPDSHGSWVSLCADDRGRLYTSDQYGGLWRVTPPPLQTSPDESSESPGPLVEPVNVELGEAQGLLWAFDSLYVVVNAGENYDSGLYRARDTDGDDALDAVELLRPIDGNGEHGPHAVLLTPDGEGLVVVAGNHTDLPEYVTRSRVPRVWDEDAVLPRIDDPNGHAVGIHEPAGWICRTDPEGKEWELLACGFRNPYDLAFHPSGELFTFDADMEWDTGLPWYRPTRILHVTSGAEFGWRSGSAKWPDWTPDSLGSVVDIGPSSPTGITFGTDTGFPEPWRSTLFAADWAFGKIFAVHIEPDGATYSGRFEPFVTGEPLPVTDIAVATDGALYFTTGGRRTQSGLYRITWDQPAGEAQARPGELASTAPDDSTRRRLALEAQHSLPDGEALDRAWAELNDPDRSLRFAARTLIELHYPARWRARAMAEDRPLASIEAWLALVRCDESLTAEDWAAALAQWPWETFAREQQVAALRVTGLGLLRIPDAADATGPLEARLLELLPSGDDVLDRELCRVLARMQSDELAGPALDLLESAPSQESAIDLAYCLSTLGAGWTDAQRARLLRWFDVDSLELTGGVSFRQYLDRIRALAVRSLGASMLADAVTPVEARTAPPRADTSPPATVHIWTAEELVPELARVTTDRDFERGREVYERTRCLECHRIAGEGGSTGPDLSGTAGRFSPSDLLDSLLTPSAVVSDQYRDVELWTVDGGVIVGRVVGLQDAVVTLRTPQDERVDISETDIESRRPHPLSRMPEGLLDTCTLDEILDLMAYVLAGGDAQH